MKKRRRYKLFLFIGLLCLCLSMDAAAQGTFAWRTEIDSVKADGFYRLPLTPEVLAKSRADLGDLRIQGSDKRFVSYVIKNSWPITDTAHNHLIPLPGAKVVQKDSGDKHSYLDVEFPEAYTVDWINFVIRNPVFYKRAFRILTPESNGEWSAVGFSEIDPRTTLFPLSPIRSRRLRIDIDNADNAPLTIGNVICLQEPRYLLVYLRANGPYRLFTGNAQATTPDYDLKYFTDSIKVAPPVLSIGELKRIGSQDQPMPVTPAAAVKETTLVKDHSGLLLWSCLLAVLLFLVYFSVRMVKAIAKKDAHDRL